MTTTRTIRLSQIANEARNNVDVSECAALSIHESADPVIVEQSGASYYIIDGYHRAAGMLNWCDENAVDPHDAEITVVVCDDKSLIASAAEPGRAQEAAIAEIYRLAGVR